MRRKILLVCFLLGCVALTCSTQVQTVATQTPARGFGGPVGLQLYSLREQFKKDVAGTLDQVRAFGITNVELAGTYGVAPEKFEELLDARRLKAASVQFSFEQVR